MMQKKLGELLLEVGAISREQLDRALMAMLVEQGVLSQAELDERIRDL